jgi:hypothetical protein
MLDMETRLARIESQLSQVLNGQGQQQQSKPSSEGDEAVDEYSPGQDAIIGTDDYIQALSDNQSPGDLVLQGGGSQLKLPPLEEIVPIISEYFVNFNTVIPLFHQPTFMRMLHEWYSPNSRHDNAAWAAVNIVMAMAHRCMLRPGVDLIAQGEKVSHCLRNAQSIVSDLVTREEDLLGLQVLLGMIVLFQGSRDTKPASVLIGTAVRLAHRMQLHTVESMQYFAPDVQMHRKRLFWMTYMLDKVRSIPTRKVQAEPTDSSFRTSACAARRLRFSWMLTSICLCRIWSPRMVPACSTPLTAL